MWRRGWVEEAHAATCMEQGILEKKNFSIWRQSKDECSLRRECYSHNGVRTLSYTPFPQSFKNGNFLTASNPLCGWRSYVKAQTLQPGLCCVLDWMQASDFILPSLLNQTWNEKQSSWYTSTEIIILLHAVHFYSGTSSSFAFAR